MGQGKLTLYSLVLQPPPFVQTLSPGHTPVISPRSPVTNSPRAFLHGTFGNCTHHAHSTRASRPPSWTFENFGLERFHFVSVLNLSNSSCGARYAPSGVSPAFIPQQQPMLVMLANKHTRNVCLFSTPSDHEARGVLAQYTLARTPLWSTMMKPYLSANGHQDPKQANGNNSGQLALCTPPLGHHLMVTSLLDLSEVIIRPMKDGDGKKTFNFGPIVTMSCHQWDSNTKNKPPKSPRQDSPVPSLPRKQTPQQPTPGPSGTRWSEELFR
ncbi:hypothetical protein O181_119974, partial [Austropuccinia psidii MF-1]|nr:hypothetical protein [Austropuccinia psidii MF-1]